jgi:hypothetical protein
MQAFASRQGMFHAAMLPEEIQQGRGSWEQAGLSTIYRKAIFLLDMVFQCGYRGGVDNK